MTNSLASNLGLLLVGLATTGCHYVSLQDDVAEEAVSVYSDHLGTPYVQGAQFTLHVNSNWDRTGWRIESSNQAVLGLAPLVVDQSGARSEATALSEGSSQIVVRDVKGRLKHEQSITVLRPDRVDWIWNGYLAANIGALDSKGEEPRLVSLGTATFQATYYAGNERLHGAHALAAGTFPQGTTKIQQTGSSEDRDWLSITSAAEGQLQVPILVGGQPLGAFSFISVPATEAASLQLYPRRGDPDENGITTGVLALPRDAAGRPLFGSESSWTLDGVAQVGQSSNDSNEPVLQKGDAYVYTIARPAAQTLAASLGALSASLTIHAKDGAVESTNQLGCSVEPGGATPHFLGAIILMSLFAAAALRRRAARCPGEAARRPRRPAR